MIKDSVCIRIDARLWNSVACDGNEIISIKQAVIALTRLEFIKFFNIISILSLEDTCNYQANNPPGGDLKAYLFRRRI